MEVFVINRTKGNVFNKESRTDNAIKTSLMSGTYTVANAIWGFVYRTIFLYFLSAQYLGINGLFTNILQLLSLADLGISSAIVFRFYRPISEGDVKQVGKLMLFFKHVYRMIFITILTLGLSICPFLEYFIKDASEVPGDVNLYVVYVLFLLQTVSSYVFSYKHTLLTADQKQYVISLMNLIATLVRYVLQILVLWITQKYVLTILINTIANILSNYILSVYTTKKYPEVFKVKEQLSYEEKREILKDTKACMFHKVGGVILSSTDNLIISKFVGLFSVGLYSNYSLIITSLTSVTSQLLGNTVSSIGNAHAQMNEEERYRVYKNMEFINLMVISILTICLYTLIDPFIRIWLGEDMVLGGLTVTFVCMQFYLSLTRLINMATINASGLFVKDIYRPLVEAFLNLIVSIFLVNKIGIAGVFAGTVISCLLTVSWREPYILFKYNFKRSVFAYWLTYVKFVLVTVLLCLCGKIFISPRIYSFISWIFAGIITFVVGICILSFINIRSIELKNMYLILKKIMCKIIPKIIVKRDKK